MGALAYLKHIPSDGIINGFTASCTATAPNFAKPLILTLWEIGSTGYKLPHPSQLGFS